MGFSLPVRVQGQAGDGEWEEMTTSEDVSHGGLSFVLENAVRVGQVLHLDVPLPKPFRRYGLSEPSYHTYALVRSVTPVPEGHRVGILFLGKKPPKDHEDNPDGRYLLPTDPKPAPRERRRHRRHETFLILRLSWGQDGEPAREERTVAENLGKGGARVPTSLPIAKGDVVFLEELGGDFRTRAEVKNVYIGKDNVPRLNLRFLDAEPPERLASA